jgi:hypothetical protein
MQFTPAKSGWSYSNKNKHVTKENLILLEVFYGNFIVKDRSQFADYPVSTVWRNRVNVTVQVSDVFL